jgi:hypothetical protein
LNDSLASYTAAMKIVHETSDRTRLLQRPLMGLVEVFRERAVQDKNDKSIYDVKNAIAIVYSVMHLSEKCEADLNKDRLTDILNELKVLALEVLHSLCKGEPLLPEKQIKCNLAIISKQNKNKV